MKNERHDIIQMEHKNTLKDFSEEENELPLLREELDERLESLGLSQNLQDPPPTRASTTIQRIREAKQFDNHLIHRARQNQSSSIGFRAIEDNVREMSAYNGKIENAVKMEILGIRKDPISLASYQLRQLWTEKFLKKPQETAESLIERQIGRVSNITSQLQECTLTIDLRIEHLESYYDQVFSSLIRAHSEAEKIRNFLDEASDLLPEVRKVSENSGDYEEKMRYAYMHRKLGRKLNYGITRINLDQKAMLMLERELPVLDSLSNIAEAYSGFLKEICQESMHMELHLCNVMGIYLAMMRSKVVDVDLKAEVSRLFSYTQNMRKALEEGGQEIVERANGSSLFQREAERNLLTLDTVLGRIEHPTYNAFVELERRIQSYSK